MMMTMLLTILHISVDDRHYNYMPNCFSTSHSNCLFLLSYVLYFIFISCTLSLVNFVYLINEYCIIVDQNADHPQNLINCSSVPLILKTYPTQIFHKHSPTTRHVARLCRLW